MDFKISDYNKKRCNPRENFDAAFVPFTYNPRFEEIMKATSGKPDMSFTKSPAMEKANKLLPLLEESMKRLNAKTSEEKNIEVITGDAFVEMNLAVVHDPNDDFEPYENEDSDDEYHSCASGDEACDSDVIDCGDIVLQTASHKCVEQKKLITVLDEDDSEEPVDIDSLEEK